MVQLYHTSAWFIIQNAPSNALSITTHKRLSITSIDFFFFFYWRSGLSISHPQSQSLWGRDYWLESMACQVLLENNMLHDSILATVLIALSLQTCTEIQHKYMNNLRWLCVMYASHMLQIAWCVLYPSVWQSWQQKEIEIALTCQNANWVYYVIALWFYRMCVCVCVLHACIHVTMCVCVLSCGSFGPHACF